MGVVSRPHRWSGPAAIGLALLLGGLIACCSSQAAEARRSPPNVLFIVTDDQRAADTMAQQVMPATNNWFRRRGTYFPNAVATTPLCCPSRASIFSGRYAHNTLVRSNPEGVNLDHSTTLQRYLKDAGYRTGLFGKFLNSWRARNNPPYWDNWATGQSGYSPIVVNQQGVVRSVNQYSTDYLREQALSFLERTESRDSQPWFMYVAPVAPHAPFTPAARHMGAAVPAYTPNPAFHERAGAANDLSDKPQHVTDEQEPDPQAFDESILGDPGDPLTTPGIRPQQLRTLMAVDQMVSSIFSRLVRNGEERDTIAFFVSDNGFMWGEHGLLGKEWPYLDSVRIAFYVHAPGEPALPAGGVDDDLVANIDLAPTALDAADLSPGTPMDGMSLLDAHERDRILLEAWGMNQSFPWASTLTRDYQYTEYYESDGATPLTEGGDPVREYYDLGSDPWQLDNRLGDSTTSNDPPVAALSDQLARDRDCAGDGGAAPSCPPGPGASPAHDDAAPGVSLELPPDNATVSGQMPLRAYAYDNVGVKGVRFAVDGQPLEPEDTAPPFELGWDTGTAAQSSVHQVTATARDAAGNTTTASASVVVRDFDIQTSNDDGKIANGDSITYRFPGSVNPGSILTGWTGMVPQKVAVRLTGQGGPPPGVNDIITVPGVNPGALGTIDLGQYDYGNGSGDPNFWDSTISMPDSRTVRIVLGGGSILGTGTAAGAMRWTVGTATGSSGSPFCSCQVLESGQPLDREF
jgi:arylsulfatase A-like enzyme